MSVVLFAGPSLPSADRIAAEGVEWRPPAEAGDLLRLDLRPGLTICLVDGYFDHRPAVRHKEILLALAAGVRVIGASSMGALRAAEMTAFGMEGIGAIFRAYASGRISGDDEVALVHAPAEWDWRPLSLPMIEVRATVCRLLRHRRIAEADARLLINSARAVHYSERSWADMLSAVAPEKRAPLQALLEREHVPLKRTDAVDAMHEALTAKTTAEPRPEAVVTSFLRALARECGVPLSPERAGAG